MVFLRRLKNISPQKKSLCGGLAVLRRFQWRSDISWFPKMGGDVRYSDKISDVRYSDKISDVRYSEALVVMFDIQKHGW